MITASVQAKRGFNETDPDETGEELSGAYLPNVLIYSYHGIESADVVKF
jgi:hypothetical protein